MQVVIIPVIDRCILQIMLSCDEIEALCHFVDSESRGLPETFDRGIRFRETIAARDIHVVIAGVPCIIAIEIATRRESRQIVNTVSAYVYRELKSDLLGAAHQQARKTSEVPTVLHAVIQRAIQGAKTHPRFQAAIQSATPASCPRQTIN